MFTGINFRAIGGNAILISYFVLCVLSALAISFGIYYFLIIPVVAVLAIYFSAYVENRVDEKFLKIFLISGSFYVLASILWPRYVAIWIPGLPSINLQRMAGVIYLLLIFLGVLVSPLFRKVIHRSFRDFSVFWMALLLFLIFRFVSIFSSVDIGSALYQFINETSVHVSLVFLGVALGAKDYSVVKRVFLAISVAFFICFVIGMVEWITGKNIFARFIDPSNTYALWAISEKTRGGGYRAQSTFGHPLTFAEFSASFFVWSLVP